MDAESQIRLSSDELPVCGTVLQGSRETTDGFVDLHGGKSEIPRLSRAANIAELADTVQVKLRRLDDNHAAVDSFYAGGGVSARKVLPSPSSGKTPGVGSPLQRNNGSIYKSAKTGGGFLTSSIGRSKSSNKNLGPNYNKNNDEDSSDRQSGGTRGHSSTSEEELEQVRGSSTPEKTEEDPEEDHPRPAAVEVGDDSYFGGAAAERSSLLRKRTRGGSSPDDEDGIVKKPSATSASGSSLLNNKGSSAFTSGALGRVVNDRPVLAFSPSDTELSRPVTIDSSVPENFAERLQRDEAEATRLAEERKRTAAAKLLQNLKGTGDLLKSSKDSAAEATFSDSTNLTSAASGTTKRTRRGGDEEGGEGEDSSSTSSKDGKELPPDMQMVDFADIQGFEGSNGEEPAKIGLEHAIEKVILSLLSPAIHGLQSIGIPSAQRRAEELLHAVSDGSAHAAPELDRTEICVRQIIAGSENKASRVLLDFFLDMIPFLGCPTILIKNTWAELRGIAIIAALYGHDLNQPRVQHEILCCLVPHAPPDTLNTSADGTSVLLTDTASKVAKAMIKNALERATGLRVAVDVVELATILYNLYTPNSTGKDGLQKNGRVVEDESGFVHVSTTPTATARQYFRPKMLTQVNHIYVPLLLLGCIANQVAAMLYFLYSSSWWIVLPLLSAVAGITYYALMVRFDDLSYFVQTVPGWYLTTAVFGVHALLPMFSAFSSMQMVVPFVLRAVDPSERGAHFEELSIFLLGCANFLHLLLKKLNFANLQPVERFVQRWRFLGGGLFRNQDRKAVVLDSHEMLKRIVNAMLVARRGFLVGCGCVCAIYSIIWLEFFGGMIFLGSNLRGLMLGNVLLQNRRGTVDLAQLGLGEMQIVANHGNITDGVSYNNSSLADLLDIGGQHQDDGIALKQEIRDALDTNGAEAAATRTKQASTTPGDGVNSGAAADSTQEQQAQQGQQQDQASATSSGTDTTTVAPSGEQRNDDATSAQQQISTVQSVGVGLAEQQGSVQEFFENLSTKTGIEKESILLMTDAATSHTMTLQELEDEFIVWHFLLGSRLLLLAALAAWCQHHVADVLRKREVLLKLVGAERIMANSLCLLLNGVAIISGTHITNLTLADFLEKISPPAIVCCAIVAARSRALLLGFCLSLFPAVESWILPIFNYSGSFVSGAILSGWAFSILGREYLKHGRNMEPSYAYRLAYLMPGDVSDRTVAFLDDVVSRVRNRTMQWAAVNFLEKVFRFFLGRRIQAA